MFFFYLSIFIISFFILAFASRKLVKNLTKIAKFLGWKEFVVAFFTMALASSIPNLSVGLSSALHGVPQLSFSEIIGGNILNLTVGMALAILVSGRGMRLASRTVQGSAIFTLIVALLPLLLVFDGTLSRVDGILLIMSFFIYSIWLFSKRERFTKTYNHIKHPIGLTGFFKDLFDILVSVILLLLAAEGIVRSAGFFSERFSLPLILIGILIVGLGNALPEIFFSIQAAQKRKSWMVAGNLMGATIFPSTLVLGLVVLIAPIQLNSFSFFVIGRFFLIIAAFFFLIFIRTGKRISKKEAIILLAIYVLFVLSEILFTSP